MPVSRSPRSSRSDGCCASDRYRKRLRRRSEPFRCRVQGLTSRAKHRRIYICQYTRRAAGNGSCWPSGGRKRGENNMAQDKKVEQITNMEDDFAQWYTDICRKAELVEYASVKGFTILRPYGYAIWENIQRIMDGEFKKTGHENVAMPVLIPESLLKKEGELVNGFAPEVAWVTDGRQREAGGAPGVPPYLRDHVLRPLAQRAPDLPPAARCSTTSGAPSSAGKRPRARSCAAVSSGGRRATPSTRPPRRPRPRPSSSSSATRTSSRTSSPFPSFRAARPRRRSSPAPRRPIPSSA